MLGSLHTSDVRRFVPRLIFQDKRVSAGRAQLPLFKLDWDSVDTYKKGEYNKWITEPNDMKPAPEAKTWELASGALASPAWKDQSADANEIHTQGWSPDTLPPELDFKVKDLCFALSDDYKRGIQHFARLFVEERTRKWGFDTCVRDHCMKASAAAINTAFYLLSDCMHHDEIEGWYRGPWKRIYLYAMQFKFWRLYTGRGLVWGKADLPELELTVKMMKDAKPDKRDHQTLKLYCEFMKRLHGWDEEQEKFWTFTAIPDDDANATETGDDAAACGVDITEI